LHGVARQYRKPAHRVGLAYRALGYGENGPEPEGRSIGTRHLGHESGGGR